MGSCPLNNISLDRIDRNTIPAYSAMDNNAKDTLPYSTLYPDTSSDSPSAKSNGLRLVSAKHLINHNNPTTGITNIKGAVQDIVYRSIEPDGSASVIKIIASLTS
jgi:hypothetical protein